MEVEDVAGVGLATGRPTQQEGHLAVGDGLQREDRREWCRSDTQQLHEIIVCPRLNAVDHGS